MPYDEAKEFPAGDLPTKLSLQEERMLHTAKDPASGENRQYVSQSSSPVDFLDGNGRSVSPIIISESPSADDDYAQATNNVSGAPNWGNQAQFRERGTVSHFRDEVLVENDMADEDGACQLSNSYVNFIEAVASVVIQTKVRQLLARIRVEKMLAQRHSRGTHLRGGPSNAHVSRRSQTITQKARNTTRSKTSTKRDAALDFYTLAAIRIQAIFRGWWVRDCLAVDNYCATMIQKTYRGWLAVDASITRVYCIVRIQSLARGYLARKRFLSASSEREYQEVAATIIQAQWRSFSCEMKFLRFYEDLLIVQSVVRGWITRRLIRLWLMIHDQKAPRSLERSSVLSSRARIRHHQQSTPPRRPAKTGSEISPSYQPHIEYMRQALTPDSVSEQHASPQRVPIRTDHTIDQRKNKDVISKVNSAAPGVKRIDEEQRQAAFGRKISETAQWQGHQAPDGAKTVRTEQKQMVDSPIPSATSRSEIEKRRKDKELENRAKEDEEKRRKEAQAAELAELEYRRKRMAMKAEARKQVAPVPESQGSREHFHSDSLPHDEEKKESDSIVQSTSSSNPIPDSNDKKKFSDSSTDSSDESDALKKNFGPWQLKKRNHIPVPGALRAAKQPTDPDKKTTARVNSHKTLPTNEAVGTEIKAGHVHPSEKKDGSRPPFARNGGNVAAMKQQLFMSKGDNNYMDKQEVTLIDVDEMNSIVGNIVNGDEGGISNVSVASRESSLPACNERNVMTQDVCTPAEKESQKFTFESSRSKDADISALTDPTASPSTVATPSTKSNAFLEQMRSIRSESEQKRLDEMHAVFQKAGLMTRTKLTAEERFARKIVSEDHASAHDLLMTWQGKQQTRPEMTGKLF
jgi:hypothetical protein